MASGTEATKQKLQLICSHNIHIHSAGLLHRARHTQTTQTHETRWLQPHGHARRTKIAQLRTPSSHGPASRSRLSRARGACTNATTTHMFQWHTHAIHAATVSTQAHTKQTRHTLTRPTHLSRRHHQYGHTATKVGPPLYSLKQLGGNLALCQM